jgi:hypothetical protein
MLRTFVNGKIHQLKATGLQPKYSGFCLIRGRKFTAQRLFNLREIVLHRVEMSDKLSVPAVCIDADRRELKPIEHAVADRRHGGPASRP